MARRKKNEVVSSLHIASVLVLLRETGRDVSVVKPACSCDAATDLGMVMDAIGYLLALPGGQEQIMALAQRMRPDIAPTQAPANA